MMSAALWIALHLLGLGLGMTAIDPDDAGSLRGMGLGVGVWSLIVPILGMFVGGLVVSRLAPTPNRVTRLIHGGLVWAGTTLVAALTLSLITASVARGVSATGSAAVHAASGAIGGALSDGQGDGAMTSTLASSEMLQAVNERLRANGKPTITAEQVESSIREALGNAIQSGDLNRTILVRALARNSALTTADVEQIADTVSERWKSVRQQSKDLVARARHFSLSAAETTGVVLFTFALSLLLSLGSAIGGALLTGKLDRRNAPRTSDVAAR